jgi:hypothetical protein
MGQQTRVGAFGESTHAYTVTAMINATIDRLSQRNSLVGGLGWDQGGRERMVETKLIGGQERDVGNTSCIQTKEITVGDEARFTLGLDLKGQLTHGTAPVAKGGYSEFLHDNVRLNVFDTPEFQLMAEMDKQRFANLITDMDQYTQEQIALFTAKWIDFLFLQSIFHGADEGLLQTTNGGLGMQLWNAPSAGYACSCKNTYVGGSGMVTWSDTRATFEASVGHSIFGLTDTSGDYFSLEAHEKILHQITSNLRFRTVNAFGMNLRAVALIDPWLLQRILTRNSNNTWYSLMKDADVRGPQNHMIDRDQSVVIDKILYIPCDWLRAFRATGADNVQPTYGCGLTSDPQTYIETADTASYKCPIIYMGAQAMLCGKSAKIYTNPSGDRVKSGRIWLTERIGEHEKGGGFSAHTKVGFKRYEPMSQTGSPVTYHNDGTLVAWFYDGGPGVTPGA